MSAAMNLFEFNQRIKQVIESEFDNFYWVTAEIATHQVNQRGHCYMELVQKEGDKVLAKARATIWANQYASIASEFEQSTQEKLKNGLHILCCIRVSFHELYGLNYNIVRIDPSYTVGERARQRQEVLLQLEKEGLLSLNSQIPLSLVPQKLAIISSKTAAGYEDFMNTISSNPYQYAFKTTLFPAIMQGEQAVESIIDSINALERKKDQFHAVLLIRGGGSQLDLDCFDSYPLAARIARMKTPLISGIGHQRDDTVADRVAHTKIKTPTAAAEYIIDRIRSFEENILDRYERVSRATTTVLKSEELMINKLSMQLSRKTVNLLDLNRQKLHILNERLSSGSRNFLKDQRHFLELKLQKIENENPEKILQKGYSITKVNGEILKPEILKQLSKNDEIITEMTGARIISTFKEIKNNQND